MNSAWTFIMKPGVLGDADASHFSKELFILLMTMATDTAYIISHLALFPFQPAVQYVILTEVSALVRKEHADVWGLGVKSFIWSLSLFIFVPNTTH